MKKIGLVGIYFPGAYETLHANVPEGFELVDVLSKEEYGKLANCEYLISRLNIDPDVINWTPNVRFWQRWGVGYDHVDLKAWGERGIPIAVCTGVNSGIVAELAVMLMLAGYRNLLQINRQMRAGHWPRTEYFGRSFMIKGKTVGVLGLGNIGKKVAKLAATLAGDEKTGANIVLKALEAPLFHIAYNAGMEGSVVISKVKESKEGVGYDALKDAYVNMLKAGILDPAKVTRSALENAASVSGMVLTTESLVADKPQPPMPAAPAPDMGGMGMY